MVGDALVFLFFVVGTKSCAICFSYLRAYWIVSLHFPWDVFFGVVPNQRQENTIPAIEARSPPFWNAGVSRGKNTRFCYVGNLDITLYGSFRKYCIRRGHDCWQRSRFVKMPRFFLSWFPTFCLEPVLCDHGLLICSSLWRWVEVGTALYFTPLTRHIDHMDRIDRIDHIDHLQ